MKSGKKHTDPDRVVIYFSTNMKAENIYNKAVDELTALAKECIQQIARKRFSHGISDGIEYLVDPWEYGVDGSNVIVWGDDYSYSGASAETIDISNIEMDDDAKNIYINGTNDEVELFANLPMNSMVFVCSILESILEKERGE